MPNSNYCPCGILTDIKKERYEKIVLTNPTLDEGFDEVTKSSKFYFYRVYF